MSMNDFTIPVQNVKQLFPLEMRRFEESELMGGGSKQCYTSILFNRVYWNVC